MFEKISNLIEGRLAGPLEKLSNQRHLRAIRDGIIATLPLIIVSSLLMVIAFSYNQMPESWGIRQVIQDNAVAILLPYRMSMYIMTLYAVFGIGYSLAKSYDLDGLSGAILAELTFLLTIVPVSIPDVTESISALAETNAELSTFLSALPSGYVIPAEYLGSAGMFIGIISAFIGVEIYRFTQVKGFKITMPAAVPPAVARSFESLTPTIIIILGVSTITMWLGINVHQLVGNLIKPLISVTDTLPSTLLIIFLIMFFWSFGIHGDSVVSSLARPIWLILLDQNTAAVASGGVATHIGVEPFLQWFVHIGGSGATLGLAILFCVKAKSKYGKTLGRTTILPSIFNINEPMIFGAPIVLNPMLLIPFIVTPLILATIAWIATAMNLVNCAVTIAPWTLPGPIGAYLACGGDWRAAVLNVILIIISIIIYYPFFKMYDNELLAEEKEAPAE
ncbi:MAG: PTS sugar transporter subunit IIC [Massilimicrobiota timonensis]